MTHPDLHIQIQILNLTPMVIARMCHQRLPMVTPVVIQMMQVVQGGSVSAPGIFF